MKRILPNFLAALVSKITPFKNLSALLVVVLLMSGGAWGQVSNYSFSSSSGASLTTMTSSTQLLGSAVDVTASSVINIGFNFTFNGITYTQFSVSSNGVLGLGSSAVTSSDTNTLTAAAAYPIIAPMWDDMHTCTTGKIHYLITGSSPNRKLVVEYLFGNYSERTAAYKKTAQVVLYETTNVVEFIYGSNSGTALASASVGISSSTTDYKCITTSSNTASSTVLTETNTIWPTSGTKYTFTPPPPCTTPTDIAASASSTAQTLATITGTFAAATTAPTGYLVVRTPTNVQPTPVTGTTYTTGANAIGNIDFVGTAAGSWTSTGLTAATTYYYWVFSYNNTTCSGGPVYSSTATTFSQSTASCPTFASTIAINGATAVPGTSYPTLTAAIADIKSCGIIQPTVIEISTGYVPANETFPITLRSITGASATNTITIREASNVSGTTITSANTTATIDINGGNYWIIDGRSGGNGTTKDLTISNTSTATGGTAVRFINEGSNNTIKYSKLVANFASTTNGVINFSTTTGSNGNDNNTIDNNSIDGNGTCAIGIYSAGTTTSTATNNSGNILSNNNIFNNFAAAINSQGIFLDAGSTDWTINSNSFYQTSTRNITSAGRYCGIEINSSGNNFTVSNNFIGGNAPSCSGTATYTSTVAARYRGISLKLGTTTASTIIGNTVNGWNVQSNSGATTAPGVFTGIYLTTGTATIGSALSPNIIGATSGTGGIVISTSGSGGITYGIVSDAVTPAVVTITNNSIGSINTIGTTTSISHSITGIETSSTASYIINSNTIGSTSTSNSINASNPTIGTTTAQFVNGINNFSTGTSVAITNNTIANLNNAYVPSSTITSSVLRGIVSSSGTNTITGNIIKNLSTAANGTGTSSSVSIIGISLTSSTAGAWSINNNTIYSLKNTNSAAAVQVTGIYNGTTSATAGMVSKNLIYNL